MIEFESKITTKKSPECKDVKYKAKAGLSASQAIDKFTIAELDDEDEDDEEVDPNDERGKNDQNAND